MKSKKNLIILAMVIAISLFGVTYAFFDYYKLGANQKITAGKVNLVFNEGEDTIDRGNIFPETVEKARNRDDNFITFTVSGTNTTEDQDIYYEIMLNEGDTETGMTRFNPKDLVFDLIEVNGETETYLVDAMSFSDINARRIWVNTVDRKNATVINKTYKLRMWLSEDVFISDSNPNANYPATGYENYYASVKVSVYGDFVEKSIPYNYLARYDSSSFWPTVINDQKANISQVNFVSMTPSEINTRVAASTINADVTDASLGGRVKAWLETDTTDASKYIMYVASDGTTYFPNDCIGMFIGFSVSKINFENIDTSNVTNMQNMFSECDKLESLDVKKFDTSNVTTMMAMFRNCTKLSSIDVDNFDFYKVRNLMFMFQGCTSLTSFTLENCKIIASAQLMSMFQGCTSLISIDLSGWDFGDNCMMMSMISNTNNLTTIDLSGWKVGDGCTMSNMISNSPNLSTINLVDWDLGKNCQMQMLIPSGSKLTSLNLSNWKINSVIDFSINIINNDITSLNLSNWDVSSLTSLSAMFNNCTNLVNLDLSNWNTQHITDMSNLFNGCKKLTSLNIDSFTFNNVTNTESMFSNMPDIATVTVGGITQQNWILGLTTTDRPAAWTTDNVVIG